MHTCTASYRMPLQEHIDNLELIDASQLPYPPHHRWLFPPGDEARFNGSGPPPVVCMRQGCCLLWHPCCRRLVSNAALNNPTTTLCPLPILLPQVEGQGFCAVCRSI